MIKLFCPNAVQSMDREKYLKGGCGASSWKVDLVPDSILGVDIRDACRIHDAMYYLGHDDTGLLGSNENKRYCDRVFLNNMLRLIDTKGGFSWVRKIRRSIAFGYYEAVKRFGGPAYWDAKNEADWFIKPEGLR